MLRIEPFVPNGASRYERANLHHRRIIGIPDQRPAHAVLPDATEAATVGGIDPSGHDLTQGLAEEVPGCALARNASRCFAGPLPIFFTAA